MTRRRDARLRSGRRGRHSGAGEQGRQRSDQSQDVVAGSRSASARVADPPVFGEEHVVPSVGQRPPSLS
ncbi:hypothetical protein, partial [Rathayibacter rathayi]